MSRVFPSIIRTLDIRPCLRFILICFVFIFLSLHTRSQYSQVFLACIIHKTLLLQFVSCLHRWAVFSLCFSYKQHHYPTPSPLLITAWLLDRIDSCSIEKLRIYSSVTHFLFFRFRGRLEDTSICCSHNKAYVEFIRNNKPVTTSFVDRSSHPV